MRYVEFRNKYKNLIAAIIFVLGTLSVLLSVIWKGTIVCFVLLIFLISLCENIFVRCPYCGKKPIIWWRKFPVSCRNCGDKY